LIKSGAIQPSKWYSAMHSSAKLVQPLVPAGCDRAQYCEPADFLGAAGAVELAKLVAAAELAADRIP